MSSAETGPRRDRGDDPSYLRRLLFLLGTATFFEGYDSAINAVVLRDLAADFGVNVLDTTKLTGPIVAIGLGAFGALFVTSIGDRVGRKPLLISTTILYALFTGLTAAATSLGSFIIFQFFARTFLIAEYATAITMVSEEFPAHRRGRALGVLTALGAFGLPVVAIVHLLARNTALGWRLVYIVGLVPLLVIAALRTRLKETVRWTQTHEAEPRHRRAGFAELLKGPHRRDLMLVSSIFFTTHFALLAASTWWPFFAKQDRHLSDGTIALLLSTAYPLGVTGYFTAGRLQDRFGRKKTGTIFLLLGLVFGIATFHVTGTVQTFLVMAPAVFFGLGVSPVLSAIASELFPTEIRASAVGFSRSIFGTMGAILGPTTVGFLADKDTAAALEGFAIIGPFTGSISGAVTLAALLYLPAAFLMQKLPESAGRELESVAASSEDP